MYALSKRFSKPFEGHFVILRKTVRINETSIKFKSIFVILRTKEKESISY